MSLIDYFKTFQGMPNRFDLAGKSAGDRFIFGANSRYSVEPIHSGFGYICWLITDAESLDPETGLPSVIRHCESTEQALVACFHLEYPSWNTDLVSDQLDSLMLEEEEDDQIDEGSETLR